MRLFEKRAVVIGGGVNHRMGLYDQVLIKDNHIDYAGSVGAAVEGAHRHLESVGREVPVVVEVRDLEEVKASSTQGGWTDFFSTISLRSKLPRLCGSSRDGSPQKPVVG